MKPSVVVRLGLAEMFQGAVELGLLREAYRPAPPRVEEPKSRTGRPFGRGAETSDFMNFLLHELHGPMKLFSEEYGVTIANQSWIALALYLRRQCRELEFPEADALDEVVERGMELLALPELQRIFLAAEEN